MSNSRQQNEDSRLRWTLGKCITYYSARNKYRNCIGSNVCKSLDRSVRPTGRPSVNNEFPDCCSSTFNPIKILLISDKPSCACRCHALQFQYFFHWVMALSLLIHQCVMSISNCCFFARIIDTKRSCAYHGHVPMIFHRVLCLCLFFGT